MQDSAGVLSPFATTFECYTLWAIAGAMTSNTDWFSDPSTLLEEVRRGEERRRRPLILDGYDDLSEIRRGGQGIVYRGVQRSTRRIVAIKVLLEGAFATATSRRRFEREIDVVSSLRHPHIVSVYDSGTTPDDRLYFVMEYVDGVAFHDHVRAHQTGRSKNRPDRTRGLLALFVKICDAVQYAHQHGVIHRDLKPSNVRIDGTGEPRILDFGLARPVLDASRTERSRVAVSRTGQFVGSLGWASPEQAEGSSTGIDVRTDVYSLGVMLYHALTDQFPYDVTGGVRDVLNRILATEPADPASISRDVDPELSTILLRTLAKSPERRYQSAGDLARDLRRYLAGEPIEARRDSTWYVLSKQLRRYRLAVATIGVFLVLTSGFAVTMGFLYRRADQAERLAALRLTVSEREASKASAIKAFLQDMLQSVDAERDGYEVKVAEVLDRAAGELDGRFADHSEVRSSLYSTLGESFRSLGRYAEATRLLDKSIAVARESPEFREADTIDVMASLGASQLEAGETDDARRTLGDALSLSVDHLGPENATTLAIRLSLVLVRREKGEVGGAIAEARDILVVQRRVLGDDHRDTLSTLRTLGVLLQENGAFDEAQPVLREAFQACVKALGEGHIDCAKSGSNLGLLLDQMGRFDDAESIYRRALDAQRRVRGRDHPETLTVLNNLATTLQHNGELAEAEALHREILSVRRRVLGGEHSLTLLTLNNLARVLHDRGKLDEAEPLLGEALDTFERTLGEQHPRTITAMGALAGVVADRGNLDEAERLFARVIVLRSRTMGSEHPATLIDMHNLAGIYRDQGRHEEAVAQYDRVLSIAGSVLPEGHWLRFVFLSASGQCLVKLRRFEEAEERLRVAWKGFRSALRVDHERTARAASRLVELYEVWGDPDEAAAIRAEQDAEVGGGRPDDPE